MLLATPEMEPPSERSIRGAEIFDEIGCATCHTPRLNGPRGPLHVYSDLLLHDMGEELADGFEMGVATGSEFRTQPLWGLAATGPYLHDGRAETIEESVLLHGGESQGSRDKAAELSKQDFDDLVEFMLSLGGRNQYSSGMVQRGEAIPPVGEYGGPIRPLTPEEQVLYLKGREVFDRNFGYQSGVGQPGFNADSCRGCHFDPVIGGAGPRDVNIIRVGRLDTDGSFVAPSMGTLLRKFTVIAGEIILSEEEDAYYEQRQTPARLGLASSTRSQRRPSSRTPTLMTTTTMVSAGGHRIRPTDVSDASAGKPISPLWPSSCGRPQRARWVSRSDTSTSARSGRERTRMISRIRRWRWKMPSCCCSSWRISGLLLSGASRATRFCERARMYSSA
jgi:hypothetical protein